MKQIIAGIALLGLAACGGGGGGPGPAGNIDLNPRPTPIPQPDPTPTVDYKESQRLEIVKAHEKGITGKDITISVVDNFSETISSDNRTHGDYISDYIEYIAPDATTNRVNAGIPGGINILELVDITETWIPSHYVCEDGTKRTALYCSFEDGQYDTGTWVPGHFETNISINDKGHTVLNSNVVNHSYGAINGTQTDVDIASSFITNYVDNGQVHVVAAGNESKSCDNVANCNFIAIAFKDAAEDRTIVVGAINDEGTAFDIGKDGTDYSNRAGILKDNYIVAPVVGPDDGTSYAAPVVAGAVALIMDKFNNTDAANATTIIFDTADDLGAPGVDAEYGHGRLNIGRALSPIGNIN